MTNITTFEDRRSNSIISNKLNSEKFTLPKLIEYSNSKNINEPNFAAGYLPAMQYSDPNSISDVFMATIAKTFEIDGAQCIRFILLNKNGKIYEDLEYWTEVLPNSFLARISCSYRNFNPDSLVLDYFIDLTDIQLNNEIDYGSNNITLINKEIIGGNVKRNDDLIKIDDRIAEFNMHKNEVFIDFFKYDFGNAIKGIDKKY